MAVVGKTDGIPFWARCTTHFRTYFRGRIGMFTGDTIWLLTHGQIGWGFAARTRSPRSTWPGGPVSSRTSRFLSVLGPFPPASRWLTCHGSLLPFGVRDGDNSSMWYGLVFKASSQPGFGVRGKSARARCTMHDAHVRGAGKGSAGCKGTASPQPSQNLVEFGKILCSRQCEWTAELFAR